MSDDGFSKAFELERFCRRRWCGFRQSGAGLIIDDDFPSRCHTAQASGQVHSITDNGIVGPILSTEASGHHLARGDAKADAEWLMSLCIQPLTLSQSAW